MKKKAELKRFIVTKSFMAINVADALLKEKEYLPEEVRLDVNYKAPPTTDAIGFRLVGEYDGY